MKLLPFNLERALAGDPVVTRDGREVTQITYFKDISSAYKVAGVVGGELEDFTKEGKYTNVPHETSTDDLFMAKETIMFGDYEAPSPAKSRLNLGQRYFVPHTIPATAVKYSIASYTWNDDKGDYYLLHNYYVYTNEEDALECAEAMNMSRIDLNSGKHSAQSYAVTNTFGE